MSKTCDMHGTVSEMTVLRCQIDVLLCNAIVMTKTNNMRYITKFRQKIYLSWDLKKVIT